jgi:hypothetical protein
MSLDINTDIRPLCDRHFVEMCLVELRQRVSPYETWSFPAFQCVEPGCIRVFISRGYFTVVDGERDLQDPFFIGCEHGVMFIERMEEENLVWRSAKQGCMGSRITNRSFQNIPSADRTPQLFLRHAGARSGPDADLSTRKGFFRS